MGLWAVVLDVITAEELHGASHKSVGWTCYYDLSCLGRGELTLVGRKLPITSDRLETEAVVPMVR
jgi:hypothetical protein